MKKQFEILELLENQQNYKTFSIKQRYFKNDANLLDAFKLI